MKSFYRLFRCGPVAGLLLFFPGLRAQGAEPSVLTLNEVLRRTGEDHPALAAQRYQERAADGLVEQAGLRPNPTLDVSLENFLGTGEMQGVRGLEATVQASQTIERGGKRERRVALASREHDIAVGESAVLRSEVLASAAENFVEVLAAQERVALADEPLKLARETLAAAESRVRSGDASAVETARARAALASAQGDVVRARAALAAARTKLAASWGGAAADVATVAGGVRLPDALPGETVFAANLANHPGVALQRAIIDGQRAALELEQAEASQDVSVGGGVKFLREGTDAALVAGLSMPLPVRNRNQGNIRAARERLAGAEQKLRAVEVGLRARFASAWQELEAAHASALNLRREVLPATEEAFAVVRSAYEEGHLPLIDVLDAQRALVAVRREILDVETACLVALARAESLVNPSFPLTAAAFSTP